MRILGNIGHAILQKGDTLLLRYTRKNTEKGNKHVLGDVRKSKFFAFHLLDISTTLVFCIQIYLSFCDLNLIRNVDCCSWKGQDVSETKYHKTLSYFFVSHTHFNENFLLYGKNCQGMCTRRVTL